MNKSFLILLTLSLCILFPSYTYAFTDVNGHWAEETINRLKEHEIISGYYDDTFKPDEDMTRAELVTVIDNILGIEHESDKYIPDITSKDWYYSNIRKALYYGIIKGNEKGRVNPNAKVTREEAVAIISRAFQLEVDEALFISSYRDADRISEWARKDFISFVRKQYITGYEDNSLKPKSNITRAEILTIIDRIIKNIPTASYSAMKITGDSLIKNRNIVLNNVEVFGNLIVGEIALKTLKCTNVIVNGNLILYAPLDREVNTISVNGKIIKVYENKAMSNLHYTNDEFGISFPIPDGASAYTGAPNNAKEYSQKDLIIVNAKQEEDYYYKSFATISKSEINRYDSIFERVGSGEVQGYYYELYDDNMTSKLLLVKRDNIIYSILFVNVASKNLIDNIISNLTFTAGTRIKNHDMAVYRNAKLALKFSYKNGYVGVDDSYNTNVIYSGDSIFKLFIQVNMITDISEYSVEELKSMLKTLIKSDGTIIKEDVSKINNHDAIQFEIASEGSRIISQYVIIGNNLYNFIFKGEEMAMQTIGEDMFYEIVNSMEF